MKNTGKKSLCILMAFLMIFSLLPSSVLAAEGEKDYRTVISELQNYQVKTVEEPVVASVGGEWTVLSLARSGAEVPEGYYEGYYNRVVEYVNSNIMDGEKLHKSKSTENSRLIVALTSIGKDPRNVDGHDLTAPLNDITYLYRQGINGPIWALIALDSHNYRPEYNRQPMVDKILELEISGGGWALSGKNPDPDITAMALYSLAKYKDQPEVSAAINRAVAVLSNLQGPDGGYSSWGTGNSESISQTIIALSELGIDADTDERFVKNGNSALDALLKFQDGNGGFKHIMSGSVDGMATDQAMEALVAYSRFKAGQTSLFTMTDVELGKSAPIVTGIKITKLPEKLEYEIGEQVSLNGIQVVEELSDGTTNDVTSKIFSYRPDTSTPGTKTVEVLYGEFSTTYEIIVKEKDAETPFVKEIKITKLPPKLEYEIGEPVDLKGIKVVEVLSNGETNDISYDIAAKRPDTSTPGTKTVEITYAASSPTDGKIQKFTTTYEITVKEKTVVEPVVTGIEITTLPTKTNYIVGEPFDSAGLEVVEKYSDNATKAIDKENLQISSVDTSTAGTKTVTVNYKGFSASFTVDVKEKPVVEPKLTGIKITNLPVKINYVVGEKPSYRGLEVKAVYDNGITKDISNEVTISGGSTATPGTKTVTVHYGTFSADFNITVVAKALEKISVIKSPKTEYIVGDSFTTEGIQVKATYNDGSTKVLGEKDLQISKADTAKAGTKTVTVAYDGKTTSYSIVVKEKPVTDGKAYVSVTVPAGPTVYPNGKVMQAKKAFEIQTGVDTAFSILQKTGLNLLYNGHAVYAGYYVSSIEGLAEFDGGPYSGWMYKVNGWFPNYSSSLYKLKDGDVVEWIYTRDLGKDIGGYVDGIEGDDGLGGVKKEITIRGAEGGIIAPSGRQIITKEKPVKITIQPKEGYVLSHLLLDGKNIGRSQSLTLTVDNVKNGAILTPVFVKESTLSEKEKEDLTKEEIKLPEVEDKPAQNPQTLPFVDISNHWAKDSILYVASKNYFKGMTPTEFGPNIAMTRGMFVTVLGRMSGENRNSGAAQFKDVAPDSYYAPFVQWAAEKGIVEGVGNNAFEPNREITREEMAKILSNYMDYKAIKTQEAQGTNYQDQEMISPWAEKYVEKLSKTGLLKGREDGRFDPKATSTRGEIATVIQRLDQLTK
ncbi:bacterial Ig-like domain-containing protein [Peptoniphilus sp. KCTC 25270]|uniref:bacterial Ig-like domain-containing protein n=1 Tax=Peptoniphilus sp. KCTC 25270 TaxID=2897414 RepID=UPI001E5E2D80|nr:bacterial Ig-like domain-containing protein [Peptoniphilus sp. KCTC 25270]MCD1147898.1 bacterial Ig-like domain-containing protein [Peptoniphilus sp. KCTC 25270]